ncbi:DUF4238 domain-containing protein [Pseudomonas fluorescens]|uniref:DUF4238 domain-containing protein n=1 Tax=Pseudomonas fluorescens TaxID=294 RepID=UPI0011CE895A|nr:DUF4238 domain-containing protein [Pseudomonas fluorescens]
MTYEPTQKGNPHALTVDQHVIPKASIKRFCGIDGRVELVTNRHGRRIFVPPKNSIFCVRRLWDERAENCYQKRIEDRFQRIVDAILNERIFDFDADAEEALGEFYLLWRYRGIAKQAPFDDARLNIERPARNLSVDSQERLERGHVGFIRPDSTIPSRMINGFQIQRYIDMAMGTLSKRRWGILKAIEGEFLVPDFPGDHAVIPVTPTIVFAIDDVNRYLSRCDVALTNLIGIHNSKDFVFARCLTNCPIACPPTTLRFHKNFFISSLESLGIYSWSEGSVLTAVGVAVDWLGI